MSRVKAKNTTPELAVRQVALSLRFRFKLHLTTLPGKPDLAFPTRKVALFVHGCFWHQHPGCKRARLPASRPEYWLPKLQRNVFRDRENRKAIVRLGWRHVVVWECETKRLAQLRIVLQRRIKLPKVRQAKVR
jgi:DNA mismatch endonuclease (patch repair protein)